MSLDASIWAWSQRVGKSSSKLVLLALADRAGADNSSFPTIETLSNDTELNRKTIISALQELQARGLVRDTGQRKGSTQKVVVYELLGVIGRHQKTKTVPKAELLQVGEKHANKQYRKRDDSENGTVPILDGNSTENGTLNGTEIGTLNSTENGTQNLSGNLSVEPVSNRAKKINKKNDLDFSNWPGEVSAQIWTDYKKLRNTKRAPVTQTVISQLGIELNKLAALGVSVDQAISVACERGWQGFKSEWVLNHLQNFGGNQHATNQQHRFAGSGLGKISHSDQTRADAREALERLNGSDGDSPVRSTG